MAGVLVVAGPGSWLPRLVVGRVLDGLTRINIDDFPHDRSILVISVNDAYAVVASRSYPPDVEVVPLSIFENADICALEPGWGQRSVVQVAGERFAGERSPDPDPDAIADCIGD